MAACCPEQLVEKCIPAFFQRRKSGTCPDSRTTDQAITNATSWVLCVALLLAGCGETPQIAPFASDGCTLFPDGWPARPQAWQACCETHDIAYWQGGTAHQRLKADERLRQCVLAATDNEGLAWAMYQGVRAGGHPVFPNWYRWGYGWPYGRGYQPLTDDESAQVAERLVEYAQDAKTENRP